MYNRIYLFTDKKHFGNRVAIYKGENNYFVIVKDRDDKAYFFVDKEVGKMYPANSYIDKMMIDFNFNYQQIEESFDIDLSKYGFSACPNWLKEIILANQTDCPENGY